MHADGVHARIAILCNRGVRHDLGSFLNGYRYLGQFEKLAAIRTYKLATTESALAYVFRYVCFDTLAIVRIVCTR